MAASVSFLPSVFRRSSWSSRTSSQLFLIQRNVNYGLAFREGHKDNEKNYGLTFREKEKPHLPILAHWCAESWVISHLNQAIGKLMVPQLVKGPVGSQSVKGPEIWPAWGSLLSGTVLLPLSLSLPTAHALSFTLK